MADSAVVGPTVTVTVGAQSASKAPLGVYGPVFSVIIVVLANLVTYLCNQNSILGRRTPARLPPRFQFASNTLAASALERADDGVETGVQSGCVSAAAQEEGAAEGAETTTAPASSAGAQCVSKRQQQPELDATAQPQPQRACQPREFWAFELLDPSHPVTSPLGPRLSWLPLLLHLVTLAYFVVTVAVERTVEPSRTVSRSSLWLTYYTNWSLVALALGATLGAANTLRYVLLRASPGCCACRKQGCVAAACSSVDANERAHLPLLVTQGTGHDFICLVRIQTGRVASCPFTTESSRTCLQPTFRHPCRTYRYMVWKGNLRKLQSPSHHHQQSPRQSLESCCPFVGEPASGSGSGSGGSRADRRTKLPSWLVRVVALDFGRKRTGATLQLSPRQYAGRGGSASGGATGGDSAETGDVVPAIPASSGAGADEGAKEDANVRQVQRRYKVTRALICKDFAAADRYTVPVSAHCRAADTYFGGGSRSDQ